MAIILRQCAIDKTRHMSYQAGNKNDHKHMKRCQVLLVFRKMQIKATRYCFIQIRLAKLKSLIITRVGKNCKNNIYLTVVRSLSILEKENWARTHLCPSNYISRNIP
jgi:hypothetical protein